MGASIGFAAKHEEHGSGTMGGFITLKKGNQEFQCGLTNHHVIRDERIDKISSRSKGQAIYPDNPALLTMPHLFVSPSNEDHEGVCDRIRDPLLKRKGSALTTSYAVERVKELENDLRELEQFDRQIGALYAASGFRYTPGITYNTEEHGRKKEGVQSYHRWALDWALINLDSKERMFENKTRTMSEKIKPMTILKANDDCQKWSTFDVRRNTIDLIKRGRTTDWTAGRISSLPVRINPKEHRGIAQPFGFTEDEPESAWGLHPVPRKDKAQEEAVCEPGDSGSVFVQDENGTWVGLLFAELGSGSALMTPIDLVIRDIEWVTGARVVEPCWVQPNSVGLANYHAWKQDDTKVD